MEKQIIEFNKGELDLDLKVMDGKLRLTFGYDGKGVDAGIYIDVESDYFLDKLAAAIPGQIDDAIIAMIKGAIKA